MRSYLWILLGSVLCTNAAFLSSYLSSEDRLRLKSVLESGLSATSSDISGIHYGALGLKLIGESIPNKDALCKLVAAHSDDQSVENLYLASAAAAALGCPLKLGAAAQSAVKSALADGSSTASLFFAAKTQASVKSKLDSAAVRTALANAVKKDDSLMSLGLAFHTAVLLDGDVAQFYDRIEDAVVQADEVDGKMLQFEGGLSVTSVLLKGAFLLSEKAKKPLSLTGDQAVKFANYLMSRKSVKQPKGAFHLLEASLLLASNKQFVPVAVTLASPVAVGESSPAVTVSVTDVAGGSVGAMSLKLDSATRQEDEAVITVNQPLKAVTGKPSQYQLDLMSSKPPAGFYDLVITATPAKSDARLVGLGKISLQVKVLTTIAVEGAELRQTDSEQTTAGQSYKLGFGKKLDKKLSVDHKDRLVLQFAVKDKSTGDSFKLHQAFVRLSNAKTSSEIIYLAEHDGSGYKFDLDIGDKAREFGSQSGEYSLTLILGDSVISNPTAWHVADVKISFPDEPSSSDATMYKAKPEIKHLFREPEPRPAKVVSNAFTVLCLSPFLLMVGLWIKLGVNISNFPVSLAGLGFHVGLGGIFSLYLYFWLQLNMFQTVQYLVVLGVVTFLCGNSLLATLAKKNKA